MSSNMEVWEKIKRPPKDALKTIRGGRLGGMTDISPQWRYQALTEQFGPCGIGWKFTIDELWIAEGEGPLKVANAKVSLFIKYKDKWSDPIPGVGGSMLVAKESAGPYTSDEAYKMAVTDAVGTAAKMIGLAADIYAGRWDGSKYKDDPKPPNSAKQTPKQQVFNALKKNGLNNDQMADLIGFVKAVEKVENLTPETLMDIAKKPTTYINEWREAKKAA